MGPVTPAAALAIAAGHVECVDAELGGGKGKIRQEKRAEQQSCQNPQRGLVLA